MINFDEFLLKLKFKNNFGSILQKFYIIKNKN